MRQLEKIVDELAKGRKMEKIKRGQCPLWVDNGHCDGYVHYAFANMAKCWYVVGGSNQLDADGAQRGQVTHG